MKKVRCLIGHYAGLVMEYPDHVAENLLDTGFAEPVPEGAVLARDRESGDLPQVESRKEGAPEWPLKTDPETYLERNPDGPKADLARKILEK